MLPLFAILVAAAPTSDGSAPVTANAARDAPGRAVHAETGAKNRNVMEEWQTYLVRRRQFLMEQIRYAFTHHSRLEEVIDGKRTDVSADWLDRVQLEYAEVTQLLINAGLLTEDQARAEAIQ